MWKTKTSNPPFLEMKWFPVKICWKLALKWTFFWRRWLKCSHSDYISLGNPNAVSPSDYKITFIMKYVCSANPALETLFWTILNIISLQGSRILTTNLLTGGWPLYLLSHNCSVVVWWHPAAYLFLQPVHLTPQVHVWKGLSYNAYVLVHVL